MNFFTLNQLPLLTDDFSFTFTEDLNVRDAIVIFNPVDSLIVSPVFIRSRKTLDEHIRHIQENDIKKAVVVGDNIDFLRQCPGLEYLRVYPSVSAENFDYSPVYDLPKLKWLQCQTIYGKQEEKVAQIDYSRVANVKSLVISGAHGHRSVKAVKSVSSLYLNFGYPSTGTLHEAFSGAALRNFSISQSPLRSLDGIEDAQNLCRLDLSYNRRLTDISALGHLRGSLACLEIDTCGKIRDFSVLSELKELEYLTLKGSNPIQNVLFLKYLPKLKYLHLTINVEDGDLSLCEAVPYVRIKNHKHYSHNDADMPKNYTDPDEAYPLD